MEKGTSDGHRSGPGTEKRNDLSACRDHEARQERRHHQGQNCTGREGFSGAYRISRAVTMSRDRGNTGAEVHDGQQDQRVDAVGRCDGGDGIRSEAVHEVLQYQTAQGADAGLYHGRQAVAQAVPHHGAAEALFPVTAFQPGVFPCAVQDDEHRHDRAQYAPAQLRNKKDIQQHVDDGGDQNGEKGDPAVPQPAQGGGIDIIDRQKRQAPENNADIAAGEVDGIRRRVQQLHKRIGQGGADCRSQQKYAAEDHGKHRQHRRDAVLFLCTEVLGDQDGQAKCEAGDGGDEEADGNGRHADGGKGQLSVHIADDEGVCPVIELLQHTAEDQRQAEPDQLFDDGS